MNDTPEQKFLLALDMLSQHCNYRLTAEMIDVFYRKLKPFKFDDIVDVIEEYYCELPPGGRMPSVFDVARRVAGEPAPGDMPAKDEIEAREAASNIVTAARKFGEVVGNDTGAWQKLIDIAQFIGPIGWDLVEKRGGWNYVCGSLTNANLPNMEVTFRELAKGCIERRRRGEILASLPKPHTPLLVEPRARLAPLSEADVFPPFLLEMRNRKKKDVDDAENPY